jgi:hypothetical protein
MNDRKLSIFSVAGSLEMAVFFGALAVAGGRRRPSLATGVAFLVMVILAPVGWYADRRAKRSKR